MSRILQAVIDTISIKPEIGIFTSVAGVAVSPVDTIGILSAILGLSVTFLTLIIKIMDIWISGHKKLKENSDGIAKVADLIQVNGKLYRSTIDENGSFSYKEVM